MDRLSGWRFSDTAVLRNTTYQELNMLNSLARPSHLIND